MFKLILAIALCLGISDITLAAKKKPSQKPKAKTSQKKAQPEQTPPKAPAVKGVQPTPQPTEAPQPPNEIAPPPAQQESKIFQNGVAIYAGYDFAKDIDSKRDSNGTSTSIIYGSTGTPFVGASYAMAPMWGLGPWGGIGWSVGLDYELERTLDSSQTNNVTLSLAPNNPKFSVLRLEPNAIINYDFIFAYLGFNYPMVVGKTNFSAFNLDMTGNFGFQIGVGAKFFGNFAADLGYRFTNFTISEATTGSHTYDRLWGMMIRGSYIF